MLQEQGRSDEAIQEAKRALEFDPLSINIATHLADAYYFARQYKQAIAQRRRVLDLHPSASEPNQNLIIDYLADGDLARAKLRLLASAGAYASTMDCCGGLECCVKMLACCF